MAILSCTYKRLTAFWRSWQQPPCSHHQCQNRDSLAKPWLISQDTPTDIRKRFHLSCPYRPIYLKTEGLKQRTGDLINDEETPFCVQELFEEMFSRSARLFPPRHPLE